MPEASSSLVFHLDIDLQTDLGLTLMDSITSGLREAREEREEMRVGSVVFGTGFVPAPPVVAPVTEETQQFQRRIAFFETERQEFIKQIESQAAALEAAKSAAALAETKRADAQKRLDAALEGLRAANAKVESLEKLLAAPPVPAEIMPAAPIEEAVVPEIEGGDDPDFEEIEETILPADTPLDLEVWTPRQKFLFADGIINRGSAKTAEEFGITTEQLRSLWNELLPRKGNREQAELLKRLKLEADREAKGLAAE